MLPDKDVNNNLKSKTFVQITRFQTKFNFYDKESVSKLNIDCYFTFEFY